VASECDLASLVSDNLAVWTGASTRKSSAGRGGRERVSFYGIERLRALILDLAVRGKLVSQDPRDEPAAEVLKRIRIARKIKVDAAKTRKSKPVVALPANHFTLPRGWEWTQLATICEIGPTNYADDNCDASFVPMASISTRIDGSHQSEVRKWGEIKRGFTHFAEGDIGLAKITPCFENGKSAIFRDLANGIGAGTTELHVARPWSDEVNRRYLLLTMKTPQFLAAGEAGMTGTAGQKRVTRSYFENALIGFPPLAEQRRIVAKVDELMALCGALERQSEEAMAAHQALVETLLATLVHSADAADLATIWARIATHFDTLFTTEASIDALKQSILELAVCGKLASQDPSEERASLLLKRVEKELGAYAVELRIGRTKPAPISDGAVPFPLPEGWAWARLSSLFKVITDGDHQPPPRADEGVAFLTIGNITTGTLDFSDCRLVSASYFESLAAYKTPKKGDILYTVVGATYGRPAFVETDREFCVQRHIAILKPASEMNVRFLLHLLASPIIYEQASNSTTGTAQPTIGLGLLRNFLAPVPPVAEQHRIVAKVDELLALCHNLKSYIAAIAQTQRHLADAIVERAEA
jgi:type I restriction enzyme, S subunit